MASAASSAFLPALPRPRATSAKPLLRRTSSTVRSPLRVISATAAQPSVAAPAELVESVLSKVNGTDRGVLLSKEGHADVDRLTTDLSKYCVEEPVKNPLIFGEWDVAYCSNPTSPGGGYRSAIGRLIFKTNEMIQIVEAPDVVKNTVSFSLFGSLAGQVSLNGKLKVLSERWIQVVFEAPELKIGSFDFRYGGQSEVKLEITYVDEKIRLGRGSRGSLFVFRRIG
uniref:PAP fibrillin n=1 Tax=Wolffia australiana TaxID=161112 RepID=H6U812_WOLAU|nr:PAP fibrillin [Wolffia australiana]